MRAILLLGAVALIAGCKREAQVEMRNASVGEVADKVREAAGGGTMLEPDRWESTVENIEIAGVPPQAQDMMKKMYAKTGPIATCLRPEDVRKPRGDIFANGAKNCRYEKFTWGGGKIDAVMTCSNQGTDSRMAFTGTYTPDSYQTKMTMRAHGGPGGREMTMVMSTASKRVGECTGKEINAQG